MSFAAISLSWGLVKFSLYISPSLLRTPFFPYSFTALSRAGCLTASGEDMKYPCFLRVPGCFIPTPVRSSTSLAESVLSLVAFLPSFMGTVLFFPFLSIFLNFVAMFFTSFLLSFRSAGTSRSSRSH